MVISTYQDIFRGKVTTFKQKVNNNSSNYAQPALFSMQESLQSGVGRKSATSVGLTTDLVHWLQAGIGIAGLVRKEVEDSGLVGHVASFREPTPPGASTTARWDDIRCRKQQGAPKH